MAAVAAASAVNPANLMSLTPQQSPNSFIFSTSPTTTTSPTNFLQLNQYLTTNTNPANSLNQFSFQIPVTNNLMNQFMTRNNINNLRSQSNSNSPNSPYRLLSPNQINPANNNKVNKLLFI